MNIIKLASKIFLNFMQIEKTFFFISECTYTLFKLFQGHIKTLKIK